jgi:hypothetical protein
MIINSNKIIPRYKLSVSSGLLITMKAMHKNVSDKNKQNGEIMWKQHFFTEPFFSLNHFFC